MKYLLPILLLLLTACGQGFRAASYIEADFREYVVLFEDTYGIEVDISIYYNELEGNTIGLCRTWSDGYREIEIGPIAWPYLSENKRINLIFHELGHCVLDRGHDDTLLSDGCAYSFMNTYNISDYCLDKHMNHYIKEL